LAGHTHSAVGGNRRSGGAGKLPTLSLKCRSVGWRCRKDPENSLKMRVEIRYFSPSLIRQKGISCCLVWSAALFCDCVESVRFGRKILTTPGGFHYCSARRRPSIPLGRALVEPPAPVRTRPDITMRCLDSTRSESGNDENQIPGDHGGTLRVAHEMHDTLAQSFAGVAFQIQAAKNNSPQGEPF